MKKEITPATIIFPLPVVLASTVDEKGKPNLITLAWVGVACSDPPHVTFSVRPGRYSHGLLFNKREVVINIPTAARMREVDHIGIVSGRDEDKFSACKLTAVPAAEVSPPLVEECPVNLECKIRHILFLGSHHMFVAEAPDDECPSVHPDLNERLSRTPLAGCLP